MYLPVPLLHVIYHVVWYVVHLREHGSAVISVDLVNSSRIPSRPRICIPNVSVVRIYGNMIQVGAPILSSYDVTRFGARARVFEPCKGCVAACFGAQGCPDIRYVVRVSDLTCRTIGFVLPMYPLYG